MHRFLTHNHSRHPASGLAVAASFLPDKFSSPGEKDRLYNPDGQENVLFAAWKRIVSGRARIAPFLPLNYRDARTVMIQNANGIKSNDRNGMIGFFCRLSP